MDCGTDYSGLHREWKYREGWQVTQLVLSSLEFGIKTVINSLLLISKYYLLLYVEYSIFDLSQGCIFLCSCFNVIIIYIIYTKINLKKVSFCSY